MSKSAVIEITDILGADAISQSLGVSGHSIRAARFSGRFPAAWYAALKGMCSDAGIDCPLSAFNMRTAPDAEARNAR